MTISVLDTMIVIAYLAAIIAAGFWVARQSTGSMRGYFLGGNRLPWYALGISNASGMFDVAGTMWMVYLLFVYGLKSVFIPWLWPAFNQIFLMIFLAAWLRRSGVMTGAEWIAFRFGSGRGATLAHLVIVAFALITVLGYMAYGFLGIGKLAATFMPFKFADDAVLNDQIYAVIIVVGTAIYAVKGGFTSVVLTEVLQFFVMIAACIGVAIIAMSSVTPEQLAAATPAGWSTITFGWTLDLDWSELLPAADAKISEDGYSLFTIFMMLVVFKGLFQSLAGPAPNYDMQRILSARTPREASLMSACVNVVLMVPRYLLIAGLAVLALVYMQDDMRASGNHLDFEALLPDALSQFIPHGLLGLTLAGLLAAFMSSFAAALNAAPAYVVNDLYKRYWKPDASEKHYVRLSYIVSAVFVTVGTLIGLTLQSIDHLIFWITSGLYGGYTAANVLKWYWWRINGFGYFAGMIAGIVFALALGLPESGNPVLIAVSWLYNDCLQLSVARVDALNAFPLLFTLCVLVCIVASLLSPADDSTVLENFYVKTRPWGFWKPVQAGLEARGLPISKNSNFIRDMGNVGIGIVWQTSLIALPIFLVIQAWQNLIICLAVTILTSLVLKFTWYDNIERSEERLSSEIRQFEKALR